MANHRLAIASPELLAAAGPAITALSFAMEGAHNSGDAVAFMQYFAAREALIKAVNSAKGAPCPTNHI